MFIYEGGLKEEIPSHRESICEESLGKSQAEETEKRRQEVLRGRVQKSKCEARTTNHRPPSRIFLYT